MIKRWPVAEWIIFMALRIAPAGAACSPIPVIPAQVCRPAPHGGTLCLPQADKDGDGIDDTLEAQLIDRFSPLLRFTIEPDHGSDKYHPMDMIDYIRHSDLIASRNPAQVLQTNAVLSTHPEKVLGGSINLLTDYEMNGCTWGGSLRQQAAIQGQHDAHSNNNPDIGTYDLGAEWTTIETKLNVGMYAHVSPYRSNGPLNSPDNRDLTALYPVARLKPNGQAVIKPSGYETLCVTDRCFKLEYYQFFGFNQAWADLGIGNHQADLAILTEIYDRTKDRLLAVSHWAHGYEMRYDLLSPASACTQDFDKLIGEERTCRGENKKFSKFNILTVSPSGAHQDEPEKAQNNQLSFAADPTSGEFAHPVVFVEAGSHEFWPSAKWGAQFAPSHAGNDPYNHYIAKHIPNLGEIEHPLSGDAQIIMEYNGYWGYWNHDNAVSPGPTFHAAWNWFVPGRPVVSTSEVER